MNFNEYKKKVLGCYIGKSVGGTLGMPFEGEIGTREISYYDPVPTEMLPNDDLDLQVVNLETILRTGLPVSRYNVGEIWLHHMEDSAPDEYGVAIANHKLGVRAPLFKGELRINLRAYAVFFVRDKAGIVKIINHGVKIVADTASVLPIFNEKFIKRLDGGSVAIEKFLFVHALAKIVNFFHNTLPFRALSRFFPLIFLEKY